MTAIINELENEIRAILHELNRLKDVVNEKKGCTENEKQIKVLLSEKVSELILTTGSFRELLNKLQNVDGDPASFFELRRDRESETEDGKD